MARRAVRAAAVGCVLTLAVACGSTAQTAGTPAADAGLVAPGTLTSPGSASDGLSLPGTGTGAGATDRTGPAAGTLPGATATSGAPTPGPTGPGGSDVTPGGPVPGIRNGEIYIGYVHISNFGAAQEAMGQSALGGVDDEQTMNTLRDYVNKQGGILGLKIHLVKFTRDGTDQSTPNDTWQQRECTAWTQDTRVFAAFTGEGDVLDPCLGRAGVLEICGSCEISTYDDQAYAKFPLLYEPTGASVTRQVPAYINGLVDAGFFGGTNVRIGLLAFDNPTYHRAADQIAGLLKSHGLALTDTSFIQESQSSADYGPALTQLQNAELRYKSEGINRVVVLDEVGAILGYGTTIADKQRWYPHWGVNSNSGAAALIASGAYVPPSQRTGLTVIGWVPGGDKGYEYKDTVRPPGLEHCLAVLAKGGVRPSGNNALVSTGQYCDGFFFLDQVLESAGLASVDAFRAAAARLGSAFHSAVTYGTSWTGRRRDGAGLVRTTIWNTGCDCFRYAGSARAF